MPQSAAAASGTGALVASPVRTVAPSDPVSPQKQKKAAAGRRTGRSRRRHPVRIVAGVGVIALAGAGVVAGPRVYHMIEGNGPVHQITTPDKLLSFTQAPALAAGMGAQALRAEIVKKGSGEASHVVDAVYEDSTGPAAKSGPVIILFIGGNLSGSDSAFISSFTGMLPGAFVISPGSLGGRAACVPGSTGHPAECAWADNDTFGLFASTAQSAKTLGNELHAMRPLVEHRVK
jgi:hypothetical protein